MKFSRIAKKRGSHAGLKAAMQSLVHGIGTRSARAEFQTWGEPGIERLDYFNDTHTG